MGAEIGFFSLNQIQKLAQPQQNHQSSSNTNRTATATATAGPSSMWNPKNQFTHHQEQEDDSWEVRAFAEDTGNIMGTTWPPRSYTCTFCRREFQSAQALGGHMNVHRRDRARLHQTHPPTSSPSPSPQLPNPNNNPTFIIPGQELISSSPHLNGQPAGLCLLYQLPNNPTATINYNIARRGIDHHHSSLPSTLLSISPFTQADIINNLMPPQSLNFPLGRVLNSANSPVINLENVKNSTTAKEVGNMEGEGEGEEEEVDLELRLGHRSTMTSSSSSN